MASNTKLLQYQKDFVKEYCENKNILFFTNGIITVLVRPEFKKSRMVAVSISTMSHTEKKFRAKVGKYYAITNFENGQYVLMNKDTLFDFLDNALCLNTSEGQVNINKLESM